MKNDSCYKKKWKMIPIILFILFFRNEMRILLSSPVLCSYIIYLKIHIEQRTYYYYYFDKNKEHIIIAFFCQLLLPFFWSLIIIALFFLVNNYYCPWKRERVIIIQSQWALRILGLSRPCVFKNPETQYDVGRANRTLAAVAPLWCISLSRRKTNNIIIKK